MIRFLRGSVRRVLLSFSCLGVADDEVGGGDAVCFELENAEASDDEDEGGGDPDEAGTAGNELWGPRPDTFGG